MDYAGLSHIFYWKILHSLQVCICMRVHTQVYMCVYSGVHTCRAQRKALSVLLYYHLPYFIETKSFTEPGARLLVYKTQQSSFVGADVTGVPMATPGLLYGFWDSELRSSSLCSRAISHAKLSPPVLSQSLRDLNISRLFAFPLPSLFLFLPFSLSSFPFLLFFLALSFPLSFSYPSPSSLPFWDRLLPCSAGWPQTHYPSASASFKILFSPIWVPVTDDHQGKKQDTHTVECFYASPLGCEAGGFQWKLFLSNSNRQH